MQRRQCQRLAVGRIALFIALLLLVITNAHAGDGRDEMPPIAGVYAPVQDLDVTLGRLMPISSAQQRAIRGLEIEYRRQCAAALATHDDAWLENWFGLLDARHLSADQAKGYQSAAGMRRAVIAECSGFEEAFVEAAGQLLTDEQRETLEAWAATTRSVERAMSQIPLRMTSPQSYTEIARRLDHLIQQPVMAAKLQQALQAIGTDALKKIDDAVSAAQDGSIEQRTLLMAVQAGTQLKLYVTLNDILLDGRVVGEHDAEVLLEKIGEGISIDFVFDQPIRARLRAVDHMQDQEAAQEVVRIGEEYWPARRPLWEEFLRTRSLISFDQNAPGRQEAIAQHSESLQKMADLINETTDQLDALIRPEWGHMREHVIAARKAMDSTMRLWTRFVAVKEMTDRDGDAADQLRAVIGDALAERVDAKRAAIVEALDVLPWKEKAQWQAGHEQLQQQVDSITIWLDEMCEAIEPAKQPRARLMMLDHVLPGRVEISVGPIRMATHPSRWLARDNDDDAVWACVQTSGIERDLLEHWAASIEWAGIDHRRFEQLGIMSDAQHQWLIKATIRSRKLELLLSRARLAMLEKIEQCTPRAFDTRADLFVVVDLAELGRAEDADAVERDVADDLERRMALRGQAARTLVALEQRFLQEEFLRLPGHLEAQLAWVLKQLSQ